MALAGLFLGLFGDATRAAWVGGSCVGVVVCGFECVYA